MPNHVHLILVPSDPDGLRSALARVHRRYAGVIQARRKRSGHFWQGRFGERCCRRVDRDGNQVRRHRNMGVQESSWIWGCRMRKRGC
jgi:REP element-mobilizing transposase RayT